MVCSDNTVLEVINVAASIDGKKLLERISFAVDRGEIVAVVGPNGAGKSTLIKLLCNELSAETGTVCLNGRDVGDMTPIERARCLAVLPQINTLSFPYTVRQVIDLGRTPHDTGRAFNDKVIEEILARLNIERLANEIYTTLSGGERQRVQLGRVLAQIWDAGDETPALLLLDEPLTALDLKYRAELMQLLRQLADNGVSIIMVMHDINVSMEYADKIVALLDGTLKYFGEVGQLRSADMFSELFNVNLSMISHPEDGRKVFV